MLSMIERHTRQPIEKMAIPNDHLIQTAREARFLTKISERLQHDNLSPYKRIIATYLENNPEASVEDVSAVLALMCHNDRPWRQEMEFPKTVSKPVKEGRTRVNFENSAYSGRGKPSLTGKKFSSTKNSAQELFRIDVGRIHGVKPGNIVGAIANEAGLQSRHITGVKVNDDHSMVCLPRGIDAATVSNLSKAWVCGRQLKLTSLGAV